MRYALLTYAAAAAVSSSVAWAQVAASVREAGTGQATVNVAAGATFSVDVLVNAASSISGVQFDLVASESGVLSVVGPADAGGLSAAINDAGWDNDVTNGFALPNLLAGLDPTKGPYGAGTDAPLVGSSRVATLQVQVAPGTPDGSYTLNLSGFGFPEYPTTGLGGPDIALTPETALTINVASGGVCERTVVGRHLFYNNSFYDSAQAACTTMNGGTPCSDNSAIAPDRVALLPGQSPLVPSPDSNHPAGPVANYSSYLLGINGIMIDIQHGEGCAPLPANLSPADIASTFEFVEGGRAVNNPYTGNVRVPTSVTVAPHPTLPNTDRVTIIFADDTSTNGRWLRCRLLPTGVIGGLAAEDRFYFGLAKAEGLSIQSGAPLTNTTDVNDAKADPHTTFTRAPITCRNDFNKDSVVNTTDQNLAKSWVTTTFTSLQLTGVAP